VQHDGDRGGNHPLFEWDLNGLVIAQLDPRGV
jgi:hypothetical protein